MNTQHSPTSEWSQRGKPHRGVATGRLTQKQAVLDYLHRHGSITQREAGFDLDIWRLSERIRELEADGYSISHTPEKREGKQWMRYALIGQGRLF